MSPLSRRIDAVMKRVPCLRTAAPRLVVLVPILMMSAALLGPAATHAATLVGTLVDGPWEDSATVLEQMRSEILDLTRGEFELSFPASAQRVGDWSKDGVRAQLDDLLADPEVDLIICLGVISSLEAITRGPLDKPVIASTVIEAASEPAPTEDAGSGQPNLHYLVQPRVFERDLKTFHRLLPFEKVALLLNAAYLDCLPGHGASVAESLAGLDFEIQIVPVAASYEEALADLEPGVDAIYVGPLLHLGVGALDRMAAEFIERGLPSFSLLGETEVERGILAGLNPNIFPRLSRRVALDVQSILLGEPPESLSVAFAAGERLTINIQTAEALGAPIRWADLTEARLVGDASPDPVLLMPDAIARAIEANRELLASRSGVDAGRRNIGLARSSLLPQLDLHAQYVVLDDDRAAATMGSQAEKTLQGSAALTQLLWSEEAWANLAIQGQQQLSVVEEHQALTMDIAREVAVAYFNVLQAKTLERIRRDDVQLSRSNLELARIREFVGQSGPAEVYRWESQLATGRREAIEANTRRNQAEMELNRLLHRPLEEGFEVVELGLEDSNLALGEEHLSRFLSSKSAFRSFRNFLVKEGLEHAPELRALDALIAAQDRALRSAGRAFWSPTLAFSAETTQRFDRSGAGSQFDPFDDNDWNLALSMSFPLFEGGGKLSLRRQRASQLNQLRLQRMATAERIEQGIRNSLHDLGSSLAGLEQLRLAAEAAQRSLDVVTDSYAQGAVDILDLLDAQNTALSASLNVATAQYALYIDLIEMQRAIGRMEVFLSDDEISDLLRRAEAHLEQDGVRQFPR